MRTQEIIESYWLELEELQKDKTKFVPGSRKGLCQCGSEMFISQTKDPEITRSYMMLGVLIDQINYSYYRWPDFETIFCFPKLWNHGTAGCMSPNWFIYRGEQYSLQAFKEYYEIFKEDIKAYLNDLNRLEKFTQFKSTLESYCFEQFSIKTEELV